MLFTPIYIALTFIKTWRIRSFRVRLQEYIGGNTSVSFCKVPENATETPTLTSKLCTNPKYAHLCDLLDYTNTTRVCSMRPHQTIDLSDWVTCNGGLPLGSDEPAFACDVDILIECNMEPLSISSHQDIVALDSIGQLVAWKAGTHLAVVLRTNMEKLSMIGFHFIGADFLIDHKLPVVRIQTVQLSGEPNKATDPSMRSLRSELHQALRQPASFQWSLHAALLRKLSKVVDIKSDLRNTHEMNGTSDSLKETPPKKTLIDVSCSTGKSLNADDEEVEKPEEILTISIKKSPEKKPDENEKKIVLENVTVEIQHNITPKKSSLKLDLKTGACQMSSSLMNISSQIKSVTTHKRIVSSSGPKKLASQPNMDYESFKEEGPLSDPVQQGPLTNASQLSAKTMKGSRPLINTKSPNIIIYSDSEAARNNLEASLRSVLDCDRYIIYVVSRDTLASGAWRGRAALVAIAGDVGRIAPLLLAHLLDGGQLLALCSDLLHTVLPYYKTAEIRENELVQFSFDQWKSVKMKHHIFCYQASPAKKQFSTESDRQPSKYAGHPGHELAIRVLASEETWRTPSLLQAIDLTNHGVAIFSQIHLEVDPSEYLCEGGASTNETRLAIIRKLLGEVLGLHIRDTTLADLHYTTGYFLGHHVHKLSFIEGCSGDAQGVKGHVFQSQHSKLTLHWLMRGESPLHPPSATYLPVHVYDCPEYFNTVHYFENLTSSSLGRLVIYADVMDSTMAVTDLQLAHGVVAVARRQAAGRGRANNQWITPIGQAAVSAQVWQKTSPRLPLIQLAAALACVIAIRQPAGYEQLDIRIKWPNDIYYGRQVKIGGVITTANCIGDDVIVNIGTGVNISNTKPTTCLNDIIAEQNRVRGSALAPVSVEMFLARYLSQLEMILESLDSDCGVDAFLQQYCRYWLHDGEEVLVETRESSTVGHVQGVDSAGWLLVQTADGVVPVTPDGNTFDMMRGLIAPK